MNPLPKIDMALATRLTREGRLDEAMAVLRGQAPPATPTPAPAESGTEGPLLDMTPPSAGGAWSFPGVGAGPKPAAAKSKARGRARAPLGEVLGRLKALRPIGGTAGGATQVEVPDGARFEQHTYAGPAGSLAYRLYVPSGRAGESLPLVVMLHGCTQSPEDFAVGTGMNAVAEEMGFLVAYPEQTRGANAQLCWNWFSRADQGRDRGEPALIAGVTREIIQAEDVDASRVAVAGLSAGGAAAAIMGAAYPDLFAAIGVHSGLARGAAGDMPSAFAAMRQGAAGSTGTPIPAIVFHGDRDATVAAVNGDAVVTQARGGATLRASVTQGRSEGGRAWTRTVEADAKGRGAVEQWVLHGAGHAWSGGNARGSYTDPTGPDASREMARFFLDHPRVA